jgi:TolB-like protein/Tfp pilus assembly protein PilF
VRRAILPARAALPPVEASMLYFFDDCVLDTERRELLRGGAGVALEPQVFDLIAFLIRERARVVSRDDLLGAVWQGRIVSESTLNSRINAARAAIGDDGTAQRLIRTLARKGVRFVGDVREEAARPPAEARPAAAEPAAPENPSIAVLPFTNMSGDAETDYFADGMAEEIITALARCGGILVIARNSSFTYKGKAVDVRQVGRELGVGYVLEGSVSRGGGRVRVTAQLIETAGGTHLWADRFDGDLAELFALQDRIAETAAAVIEPRMRYAEADRARRQPPRHFDAYDLWLRALAHASEFTQEGMQAAHDCLDRALAIDPAFAPAMASAAFYHAHCSFQGWVDDPDGRRERALRLAYDSVAVAKNDSNVLWQAAFAIWTLDQNGPRARELFDRSLAANPNSAMALAMAGWAEAASGNPARGRALLERSQRLNPRHSRDWFVWAAMAITCLMEGDYAAAADWAEKALAQNRRFGVALRALAVALVNTGHLERARRIVDEARAADPRMTVSALLRRIPLKNSPIYALYRDSLREAGLPE